MPPRARFRSKGIPPSVRVTVECVSCKTRKEIGPGDVAPGDVPSCDKCLSPCVAVSARGRL